jgi:hypothetical protein
VLRTLTSAGHGPRTCCLRNNYIIIIVNGIISDVSYDGARSGGRSNAQLVVFRTVRLLPALSVPGGGSVGRML